MTRWRHTYLTIIDWPIRRPGVTLIIAALLTLVAAWTASRLRPTGAVESLLSRTEPSAQALAQTYHRFGAVDQLLVLIEFDHIKRSPTADADAADIPATGAIDNRSNNPGRMQPDMLAAFAASLRQSIEQSPALGSMLADSFHRDPNDLRNYIASHAAYYLADAGFASFLSRLDADAMASQMRRNRAMLAAPGPAMDRVGRQLIRDPLRLRELLASSDTDAETATKPSAESASLPTASLSPPSRPAARHVDPFVQISDVGDAILLRLPGKRPLTDTTFRDAFLAAARIVIEAELPAHAVASYAGGYAVAHASESAIKRDMILSVTSAVIMLQLLFILLYRRWLLFPLAILPVALGLLWGIGAFAAFNRQLTPLAAVLGGVLAGLSIDYVIHLLSHVAATQSAHRSLPNRLRTAIAELLPAITAAWLTTLAGFLTLGLIGSQSMRDFAIIGALGLTGAMIASITVFPASLLLVARIPGGRGAPLPQQVRLNPAVWMATAVRHRIAVITITVAILGSAAAAMVAFGPPQPSASMATMHPQPNPALDAQRRIAERFAIAGDPWLVLLQAPDDTQLAALSHDASQRLDALSQRLKLDIVGPTTFLPPPNQQVQRAEALAQLNTDDLLSRFDTAAAANGFRPAAFDEFRRFLVALIEAPAPTLDQLRAAGLTDLLAPNNTDTSEPHLAVIAIRTHAAAGDRRWRDQAISDIRAALAPLPDAVLTGLPVVAADTEHHLMSQLGRLGVVAGAVVMVILFTLMRRPRLVLVALTPLVFASIATAGVMTVVGEQINPINLAAVPLMAGLAIDDGIFMLWGRRRRTRTSAATSTHHDSSASAGHAVLMTSLTTMLGFGSLITASVPAIQSLGRVMCIAVAGALVASLFLIGALPIAGSSPPIHTAEKGDDEGDVQPNGLAHRGYRWLIERIAWAPLLVFLYLQKDAGVIFIYLQHAFFTAGIVAIITLPLMVVLHRKAQRFEPLLLGTHLFLIVGAGMFWWPSYFLLSFYDQWMEACLFVWIVVVLLGALTWVRTHAHRYRQATSRWLVAILAAAGVALAWSMYWRGHAILAGTIPFIALQATVMLTRAAWLKPAPHADLADAAEHTS